MSRAIDSSTQLVGLIGWPVEHSLSPAMHNAAFEALGLNWRYIALPVRPGYVGDAVRGIVALGLHGANVTVPHKQAVFQKIKDRAPSARVLGAANTLVVDWSNEIAPTITAHNTDAQGFTGALHRRGIHLQGIQCVVVGAGGAARAVVSGLLQEGASDIILLNRTLSRAETMVAQLVVDGGVSSNVEAMTLTTEHLLTCTHQADLLVNATSVGMWPHTDESIWPAGHPIPATLTVFDLVYNPLETRLLAQARESGANPIDGLGMLVMQGAAAFELWTDQPAPSDLMRTVCERELDARQ